MCLDDIYPPSLTNLAVDHGFDLKTLNLVQSSMKSLFTSASRHVDVNNQTQLNLLDEFWKFIAGLTSLWSLCVAPIPKFEHLFSCQMSIYPFIKIHSIFQSNPTWPI